MMARTGNVVEDEVHVHRQWRLLAIFQTNGWKTQILSAENHARLERLRRLAEEREEREMLRRKLAEHAVDGQVWVYRRSMDCDCAVSEYVTRWPADLDGYVAAFEAVQDWAEGPETVAIISAVEAAEFGPRRSRDLALEAHENGHPHVVYA